MTLEKLIETFGTEAIFMDGGETIICLTADIMNDEFAFEDIQLPQGVEWAIAMGDDHPHAVVLREENDFDGSDEFIDYIVDFIGNPEEDEEEDEDEDEDY